MHFLRFCLGLSLVLASAKTSPFVARHAQCRLCTRLGGVWCPTPDSSLKGNATDSDGECQKQGTWCSRPISEEEKCPGDQPSSKLSCTLCALDGYVWCPFKDPSDQDDGKRESTSDYRTEYDGQCQKSAECHTMNTHRESQRPQMQSHTHGHGHMKGHMEGHTQGHMSEEIQNGLQTVEECRAMDSLSPGALLVLIVSMLLWLGSLCGCCCLVAGGFFLVFRSRRRAWTRPQQQNPQGPGMAVPQPARMQAVPMYQLPHQQATAPAIPVAYPPVPLAESQQQFSRASSTLSTSQHHVEVTRDDVADVHEFKQEQKSRGAPSVYPLLPLGGNNGYQQIPTS